MIRVRDAAATDADAICRLYRSAFPEGESDQVANLALALLDDSLREEAFVLIAETDDAVVGHVAFSRVTLEDAAGWRGYILAPLAVSPECQKRRIGSTLVRRGIERLAQSGTNTLFVYGDPDYYGRFGFKADAANRFRPPCDLQYPFGWLAMPLMAERGPGLEGKLSCVPPLNDPALW